MGQALITRRGGSGALSLSVIAISSANNLPSSAANGTVAIVSATAIVNTWVGNDFPTGVQAGDAFIRTTSKLGYSLPVGLSARFVIYPAAVYQYVGGLWVERVAYFRTGNAWVNAAYIIYNYGELLAGVWTGSGTGGWLATYANRFIVGCSNNANGVTNNQYNVRNSANVDMTEYRTMHVLCDLTNPGASGGWSIAVGVANVADTTFAASFAAAAGTVTDVELTVDVSSLAGPYRPQVFAGASRFENVTRSIDVKRVWFTR